MDNPRPFSGVLCNCSLHCLRTDKAGRSLQRCPRAGFIRVVCLQVALLASDMPSLSLSLSIIHPQSMGVGLDSCYPFTRLHSFRVFSFFSPPPFFFLLCPLFSLIPPTRKGEGEASRDVPSQIDPSNNHVPQLSRSWDTDFFSPSICHQQN
ncbi:uncharacterized protein LY79DRAFT_312574 [Colletotrichum navitas]|uniref:Uncharacterized protein n=1 Tax=Colletotrichum navitas TaxID=681940 RepID=A0AAD8V1Z3_9PEZI|nr:uncharacterized protein LY79DRAFT_312574 [Colletotrichum navitas]KAK1580237.1 hypothetical protein LY79DRAFT_312574 [Colletotrichum navitas]